MKGSLKELNAEIFCNPSRIGRKLTIVAQLVHMLHISNKHIHKLFYSAFFGPYYGKKCSKKCEEFLLVAALNNTQHGGFWWLWIICSILELGFFRNGIEVLHALRSFWNFPAVFMLIHIICLPNFSLISRFRKKIEVFTIHANFAQLGFFAIGKTGSIQKRLESFSIYYIDQFSIPRPNITFWVFLTNFRLASTCFTFGLEI